MSFIGAIEPYARQGSARSFTSHVTIVDLDPSDGEFPIVPNIASVDQPDRAIRPMTESRPFVLRFGWRG
jgi:hypothetical protein